MKIIAPFRVDLIKTGRRARKGTTVFPTHSNAHTVRFFNSKLPSMATANDPDTGELVHTVSLPVLYDAPHAHASAGCEFFLELAETEREDLIALLSDPNYPEPKS